MCKRRRPIQQAEAAHGSLPVCTRSRNFVGCGIIPDSLPFLSARGGLTQAAEKLGEPAPDEPTFYHGYCVGILG